MRVVFIGCVALGALVLGVFLLQPETKGRALLPTHTLRIADIEVRVVLADTPALRAQGLSGVGALGEREGMLFVFEEDGRHGFWMKDMLFPIDIMWLSAEWEVVHIAHSVVPSSYPTSFVPQRDARYVLEVRSGFADTYGIKNGTRATLVSKAEE